MHGNETTVAVPQPCYTCEVNTGDVSARLPGFPAPLDVTGGAVWCTEPPCGEKGEVQEVNEGSMIFKRTVSGSA